ncbi:MAG: stage V sporulation protein SpoVM [Ruminococcaceae bacterium]|nr:stage V sporulation protein SpoVM [Oscillospiraceae bacterium]
MRACPGSGDRDRCDFSRGLYHVSRCVPSHILRDRPDQTAIGGETMKIVVWKSPKALSGILRRLFGIKKEE